MTTIDDVIDNIKKAAKKITDKKGAAIKSATSLFCGSYLLGALAKEGLRTGDVTEFGDNTKMIIESTGATGFLGYSYMMMDESESMNDKKHKNKYNVAVKITTAVGAGLGYLLG